MQTIEEYKEYTRQLEGEVKTWRDAYNAIVIERNQLLKQLRKGENDADKPDNDGHKENCKQSRNGGGAAHGAAKRNYIQTIDFLQ